MAVRSWRFKSSHPHSGDPQRKRAFGGWSLALLRRTKGWGRLCAFTRPVSHQGVPDPSLPPHSRGRFRLRRACAARVRVAQLRRARRPHADGPGCKRHGGCAADLHVDRCLGRRPLRLPARRLDRLQPAPVHGDHEEHARGADECDRERALQLARCRGQRNRGAGSLVDHPQLHRGLVGSAAAAVAGGRRHADLSPADAAQLDGRSRRAAVPAFDRERPADEHPGGRLADHHRPPAPTPSRPA